MSRLKATRIAVSACLSLAGLATALVVGTGTASAASGAVMHPDSWCTSGGIEGYCALTIDPTVVYAANGDEIRWLPQNATVNVECWYRNTTPGSDGYWDHVSWTSPGGSISGHVDDWEVDFGGHTPPNVGLPQCAS